MRALLVIAVLLSAGAASAETNFSSPEAQTPTSHMVRNVGFAEQGDAIVVRPPRFQRVPATGRYGGNYHDRRGNYSTDCYYNQDDERVCVDDGD